MHKLYLPLLVALTLLATPWIRTASAEEKLTADVMKVALHTSTDQENGFIEHVLHLVDQKVLPLDLVQSTFLWARKKPVNKFFYFKEGLVLRAKARGINL
jgi:hypothetical protein